MIPTPLLQQLPYQAQESQYRPFAKKAGKKRKRRFIEHLLTAKNCENCCILPSQLPCEMGAISLMSHTKNPTHRRSCNVTGDTQTPSC